MEGKSEQKRSSIGLSRVSGSALCDVDKTTSGSHVASGEEDQETVPPVRLSRTVLGDGQSEKVDFNDVGTGLEDQLTNEKLQQLYQVDNLNQCYVTKTYYGVIYYMHPN